MYIIYYKDSTGKITGHENSDGGLTLAELKARAKDFNTRKTGPTVHIAEVADNSLDAYLFRKIVAAKSKRKDDLSDILYRLDAALQRVQDFAEGR